MSSLESNNLFYQNLENNIDKKIEINDQGLNSSDKSKVLPD